MVGGLLGWSAWQVGIIGCFAIAPSEEKVKKVVRLGFKASNNETEYEADIQGIRIASKLGVKCMLDP